MEKTDGDLLRLRDDPEFVSRYDEIKAAILEETRSRNILLPEVSGYHRGNFVKSYLSNYGVS